MLLRAGNDLVGAELFDVSDDEDDASSVAGGGLGGGTGAPSESGGGADGGAQGGSGPEQPGPSSVASLQPQLPLLNLWGRYERVTGFALKVGPAGGAPAAAVPAAPPSACARSAGAGQGAGPAPVHVVLGRVGVQGRVLQVPRQRQVEALRGAPHPLQPPSDLGLAAALHRQGLATGEPGASRQPLHTRTRTSQVQNRMDDIASLLERLSAVVSHQDPLASVYFYSRCLVLALLASLLGAPRVGAPLPLAAARLRDLRPLVRPACVGLDEARAVLGRPPPACRAPLRGMSLGGWAGLGA
jgi:hypothetical protein